MMNLLGSLLKNQNVR